MNDNNSNYINSNNDSCNLYVYYFIYNTATDDDNSNNVSIAHSCNMNYCFTTTNGYGACDVIAYKFVTSIGAQRGPINHRGCDHHNCDCDHNIIQLIVTVVIIIITFISIITVNNLHHTKS